MIAAHTRLAARFLIPLILSAFSLRAEIQCSGIFVLSTKAFFSFTDTESKRTTGWLNIGDSFDGFVITSFDRQHDTVTIKRDEQLLEVRLRQSKVMDGGSSGGAITSLPPLETIKGLVGLDEIIARRGRAEVEKRLLTRINQLPEKERAQFLADLMSGNKKNIFVPAGGVTEAFAKKYDLTAQQIASAQEAEEIGRTFVNNERASKAARAGTTQQSPQ